MIKFQVLRFWGCIVGLGMPGTAHKLDPEQYDTFDDAAAAGEKHRPGCYYYVVAARVTP